MTVAERHPFRRRIVPAAIVAVLHVALFAASWAGEPDTASHAGDGMIASLEPGWPQWRGIRRDGISDETDLRASWPDDGPPRLWKVDGLGTGWSSPIVVGQRVYITGDVGDWLTVFAYDRDGRLQWQVRHGQAWKGSYPGARAACAYWQGRLYHLNAHGRLYLRYHDSLWCFDVRQ